MLDSQSQKKMDAAVELGFLNKKQIESLESERRESNYPALEIAIRKGLLNREQLDILNIFADPESVVPGYRIDGFLGQGGVGTVYKATQIRMDRPVAIKTIHRSAARNDLTPKRFEREARIVGQLRHPNIIHAFDFGIHNEQLFLVMEFVDGIDAEKLLLKHGRLPEIHAWFIALQVCHALANANQMGITHRDIKPGNLILTEAPAGTPMPAGVPFVKVGDFGLAKFSDRQMDATITIDKGISGTPFYMSAEQIQALETDHRSDIYSLGATIWHLITGAPPVGGNGPLDVITSKMKLEDTWLEATNEMSPAGFELLVKMCRHDREQRIDDYSELSCEIDSVLKLLDNPEQHEVEEIVDDYDFSPSATVTTIRDLAKTFTEGEAVDHHASQDFVIANQGSQSDSLANWGDFSLGSDAGHQDTSSTSTDLAGKTNQQRRSLFLWPFILLCGLIVPATIYFSRNWEGNDSTASSQDEPDSSYLASTVREARIRLAESRGFRIPLFSGTGVDPKQKSSGSWELVKGGEGAMVLSGKNGFRNFRCLDGSQMPMTFYRFVCGFRHHESDLIEFKFKNSESLDEDAEPFFSVAITPDMATLVAGKITGQCELQQFNDDQNFGYHQFRIESQPGYWRVEVDRELLGEIEKPAGFTEDNSLIQLSVSGKGSAHFEGINFLELAGKPNQ
ncbi:serine/threonine protein kinase [Mariniblastus sp.]|nr:serine/threonine protein kinase [Mariniblastus sp.]